MSTSSYQQLAKEMMDLWQKQLSAAVGDKQFIHAMLDMFQTMQKGTYAAKPADPNPAPAHDDAFRLDELAFRVAMCEKRLAVLESALAGKKPKPKSGAAQKNPRKGSKKPRR